MMSDAAQKDLGGRARSLYARASQLGAFMCDGFLHGGEASAHIHRISENGAWRKCEYCGARIGEPTNAHIDHIVPLNDGGPHIASNLAVACFVCNSAKGARAPSGWRDMPWFGAELALKREATVRELMVRLKAKRAPLTGRAAVDFYRYGKGTNELLMRKTHPRYGGPTSKNAFHEGFGRVAILARQAQHFSIEPLHRLARSQIGVAWVGATKFGYLDTWERMVPMNFYDRDGFSEMTQWEANNELRDAVLDVLGLPGVEQALAEWNAERRLRTPEEIAAIAATPWQPPPKRGSAEAMARARTLARDKMFIREDRADNLLLA